MQGEKLFVEEDLGALVAFDLVAVRQLVVWYYGHVLVAFEVD